MVKYQTITEARQNLPTLVDRAKRLMDRYVITVNGKPEVVMLSNEEYESLIETLDILSEPGALEEIKQAEKEFDQGRGIPWEEVKKELGLE